MLPQHSMDCREQPAHLFRYGGFAISEWPEQLQQEGQVAAEIIERDHGDAVAHQGVIGVVPFRPRRSNRKRMPRRKCTKPTKKRKNCALFRWPVWLPLPAYDRVWMSVSTLRNGS